MRFDILLTNRRAPNTLVIAGFLLRRIHHRGTEFAEFGEFLNQKLFTPRPPRLSLENCG
jgi:hypothetical protein